MAFQAIVTKYLPTTTYRGSRIKATASAGSVTIPYPHEFTGEKAHEVAAKALADKYDWLDNYRLIGGGLPDGNYVFVMVRKDSK